MSEPIDPRALAALITEPYGHRHPNVDEVFIGVNGVLAIETEDERVEPHAGELYLVPAGVAHMTEPVGGRAVNLTIERADLTTDRL